MRSFNSRHPKVLMAMGVLYGLGCQGGISGPITPVGTYEIRTINGNPLPTAISRDSALAVIVLHGTITLTDDHRFRSEVVLRETSASGTSSVREQTATGSVTTAQDAIILTNDTDGFRTTVEVTADGLSYISSLGNVYEMRRVAVQE